MSLSKPYEVVYSLIGAYLQRLYTNPVKTKALTSCLIAALGNVVSQKLSGAKRLNEDSVMAFAFFGLLFGGPGPHYFYKYVHQLTRSPLGILLLERLVYTPCFQALALYMIAIFEGKPHRVAKNEMQRLYLPMLIDNLKYLTLLQYINIKYVPSMLRVLVINLVGFAWIVYLASKRAKALKRR